jgi:acetyl-CoA acetyltransferase
VPVGGGPALVETGFTALGGVLPVNASGGLLSLGELDGASAVAQVCELTAQLTGGAGARQVTGARIALAHGRGPADAGGGRHAAITLLGAA